MKHLLLLAATTVASASFAVLPGVVMTSISGDPLNTIPGGQFWQTGNVDPFDSIRLSPDGTKWAISGEQENGTSDLDIIVTGTRSPWTITAVVAREGDPTGFLAENWGVIRDTMSIANDGTVYFAGDTTNATNADDIVVAWLGTSNLIAREGSPAPGLTNINFGSTNNCVHATNDGRIRWISTGLTGTGTVSGQTGIIYQLQGGNGTILAQTGSTIMTGQAVAPDQTVTTFTSDRLQSAAETGDTFFNVTFAGPATSNVAMIRNNAVVIQETMIPPGSGSATGVTSLSSGDAHKISSNGAHLISRGALLTSNNDYVLLNNNTVAQTDGSIATGSTELWDDNSGFTTTFFFSTCNNYGEYAIGGTTNNSNAATNAGVVFSAAGKTTEMMREGDPVDINGNGLPDDNAFISIFHNETMTVTDGNMAYLSVALVDNAATFIGDAVFEVKFPLTGDVDNSDEVDAVDIDQVIAAFGSTTPGIIEDVDGSGEVDAVDIDIVIANFGRTR